MGGSKAEQLLSIHGGNKKDVRNCKCKLPIHYTIESLKTTITCIIVVWKTKVYQKKIDKYCN